MAITSTSVRRPHVEPQDTHLAAGQVALLSAYRTRNFRIQQSRTSATLEGRIIIRFKSKPKRRALATASMLSSGTLTREPMTMVSRMVLEPILGRLTSHYPIGNNWIGLYRKPISITTLQPV